MTAGIVVSVPMMIVASSSLALISPHVAAVTTAGCCGAFVGPAAAPRWQLLQPRGIHGSGWSAKGAVVVPGAEEGSVVPRDLALGLGLGPRDGVDEPDPAEAGGEVELEASAQDRSRREALARLAGLASAVLATTSQWPDRALAEDGVTVTNAVPMKTFDDPAGLFTLRVPQRFYTLRRSAKGDLPDAKTGKGRRGSSIFTAGDMAKAEVIAVERLPTRSLLEDEGIDASGDLSTFPSLGKPEAIAELLLRRREKDRPGQGSQSKLVRDTVAVSDDGRTLQFQLETQIEVQKPELLLEQTGLSELVRVTLAKARIVGGGDAGGQIMACYASALKQDYDGPDGGALKDSIASFDAR